MVFAPMTFRSRSHLAMVSDVGQVFGVGVEGLDVGIGADNDNVPNSGKRNKKIPIRRGSAL